MARYIGKNEKGDEVFAYDFKDVGVKDVGDNEIELIGSTEHVDRDGEVLKMDGWDLKAFKKNPVVLPSHLYFQPAIGKAKVKIEGKKMLFTIEFPKEGINPVADVYKGLYKGGFMRASSVGFLPKQWEWGETEKDPRRTFTKQELLEISLVSVPANPHALVTAKGISEAVEKGKIKNADVKVLEQFLEETLQLSKEQPLIFDLGKFQKKDPAPEPSPKPFFKEEEITVDEAVIEKVADKIYQKIETMIKQGVSDAVEFMILDKTGEYLKTLSKKPDDTTKEVDSSKAAEALSNTIGEAIKL